MTDACSSCPNYIVAAVRTPVEKALSQVRSVKRRVLSVNAVLKEIVGTAAADIAAVIAIIPIPPILDLAEIVSALTCPLTPLALAVDAATLANLDPREVFALIQNQIAQFTQDIIEDYDNALAVLASFRVVQIAQRFLEDLLRINLDVVLLAEAVTIAAFVESTCPEEFADGPYKDFQDEISGFSLDGVIPSTLDSGVSDVLTELQTGNTKIEAWKTLGSAPIAF